MAPNQVPEQAAIEAGQAVYSDRVLKIYDLVVHGLSNHLLWRCPTRRLTALYDRHVSDRHLDVGVGSGYFLDRARFPASEPKITLLDLNPSCLAFAAKRIQRYRPQTVQADVFQALPEIGPFRSIGLTYLLHCLPGRIAEKAIVFDHLAARAEPGARLFGATLLQGDAPRSWAARRLMATYNRKGVFSNAADRFQDLEAALTERFSDVETERVGCAALFSARV
ncbi:MAG: class I SAM-dependent methyltransferase [Kiloniellales bacterium]